jgi:hypothetical protein
MKFRQYSQIIIAIMMALTMEHCAVTTKMEAYPKMYEKSPVSILVLPPMNQSTAAEAQEFYQATINEPLTLSGYYAYPIEVVSDILKKRGYVRDGRFPYRKPCAIQEILWCRCGSVYHDSEMGQGVLRSRRACDCVS